MKRFAVFLLGCAMLPLVSGQDKSKTWSYRGMSRDLAMMDAERDEYASHLACYAANQLAETGSGPKPATLQRMVEVAKLLSPKNKRAVVLDYQMKRNVKPERVPGAFTAASLARLFMTRGKLLLAQDGPENQWVGRAFLHLAAEMDPKNEDAVYASVLDEMEKGDFDWSPPGDPQRMGKAYGAGD